MFTVLNNYVFDTGFAPSHPDFLNDCTCLCVVYFVTTCLVHFRDGEE